MLLLTLSAALAAPPLPVVLVVDGAGDFGGCSTALRVAADGWPLDIRRFPWSHGYRKIIADQTDAPHALRMGRQLAAVSRDVAAGGASVSLVGHSAGAAVVLAAAESLPPGTLCRIALLAPSVSAKHDLTAARRATRHGIDVFASRRDVVALALVTGVVGTSDGRRGPAAGRVGFRAGAAAGDGPEVRVYFWSPQLRATGHDGGHYGAYAAEHLRAFVLPGLAAGD
jgi:hypothetical protein